MINAVATKSEGVDGRWGSEIRFNLVCRTAAEAEKMRNTIGSIFKATNKGKKPRNVGEKHEEELERCNWFPHTMRSVKLVDPKIDSIESFQHSGLLDISFGRNGKYPPLHQPAKALQIARAMAMLLKTPVILARQSRNRKVTKGNNSTPRDINEATYQGNNITQSIDQFAGGLGPRAESSINI